MTQKINLLSNNWWSKIVAVIALVNFTLVIFNYSYIPLRNFYLKHNPSVVSIYDPVKSIQFPSLIHTYLDKVDALAEEINQQELEEAATINLLQNLRQESLVILDDPSFFIANQWQILANIKRQIQDHTNTVLSDAAFSKFWSRENLIEKGTDQELQFFNSNIRPLLEIIYYRPVNQNGQQIDNFWQIDLFFNIFFALEFLKKIILRSWQHPEQALGKIILRRWYDGLFLLPFWRWLRIIPLTVKLHQSRLVNVEWFLGQLTYELAAYLSDRISNFLMVRLINQTKDAINNGKISHTLLEPQPYIKVSSVDKADAIMNRLLQLTIYNILPKIQPDLEALLRHSLKGTVLQSDFYQGLLNIPGIQGFPTEAIEQLADYLAARSVEIITNSYSDVKGRELFDELSQKFKKSLQQELHDKINQTELKTLLSELLEEIKLNYVQRSTEHDPEAILEEAEQIRYVASLGIKN